MSYLFKINTFVIGSTYSIHKKSRDNISLNTLMVTIAWSTTSYWHRPELQAPGGALVVRVGTGSDMAAGAVDFLKNFGITPFSYLSSSQTLIN